MSGSFICRYCNYANISDERTEVKRYVAFDCQNTIAAGIEASTFEAELAIAYEKCANCKKVSVSIRGLRGFLDGRVFSFPERGRTVFPSYIPLHILNDYYEAQDIVGLSPKSSATLARRCLQAMIRDFWGIHEKNLNAEITALKDKMPLEQWNAIDGLRKIGNVGAHMFQNTDQIVEIDEGEAEKLIRLLELLMKDWYVQRYNRNKLYEDISSIADEKTT